MADWSDAEMNLALSELKTTPLEVLTDTPSTPQQGSNPTRADPRLAGRRLADKVPHTVCSSHVCAPPWPVGPFLLLSGIAIWRDGMAPWGILPCRDYLDVCAPGGILSFLYFGLRP